MIKFFRPVFELSEEVFSADSVHELEPALEDMFVRQNYAEYVDMPKLKKTVKRKLDNAHLEGE